MEIVQIKMIKKMKKKMKKYINIKIKNIKEEDPERIQEKEVPHQKV